MRPLMMATGNTTTGDTACGNSPLGGKGGGRSGDSTIGSGESTSAEYLQAVRQQQRRKLSMLSGFETMLTMGANNNYNATTNFGTSTMGSDVFGVTMTTTGGGGAASPFTAGFPLQQLALNDPITAEYNDTWNKPPSVALAAGVLAARRATEATAASPYTRGRRLSSHYHPANVSANNNNSTSTATTNGHNYTSTFDAITQTTRRMNTKKYPTSDGEDDDGYTVGGGSPVGKGAQQRQQQHLSPAPPPHTATSVNKDGHNQSPHQQQQQPDLLLTLPELLGILGLGSSGNDEGRTITHRTTAGTIATPPKHLALEEFVLLGAADPSVPTDMLHSLQRFVLAEGLTAAAVADGFDGIDDFATLYPELAAEAAEANDGGGYGGGRGGKGNANTNKGSSSFGKGVGMMGGLGGSGGGGAFIQQYRANHPLASSWFDGLELSLGSLLYCPSLRRGLVRGASGGANDNGDTSARGGPTTAADGLNNTNDDSAGSAAHNTLNSASGAADEGIAEDRFADYILQLFLEAGGVLAAPKVHGASGVVSGSGDRSPPPPMMMANGPAQDVPTTPLVINAAAPVRDAPVIVADTDMEGNVIPSSAVTVGEDGAGAAAADTDDGPSMMMLSPIGPTRTMEGVDGGRDEVVGSGAGGADDEDSPAAWASSTSDGSGDDGEGKGSIRRRAPPATSSTAAAAPPPAMLASSAIVGGVGTKATNNSSIFLSNSGTNTMAEGRGMMAQLATQLQYNDGEEDEGENDINDEDEDEEEEVDLWSATTADFPTFILMLSLHAINLMHLGVPADRRGGSEPCPAQGGVAASSSSPRRLLAMGTEGRPPPPPPPRGDANNTTTVDDDYTYSNNKGGSPNESNISAVPFLRSAYSSLPMTREPSIAYGGGAAPSSSLLLSRRSTIQERGLFVSAAARAEADKRHRMELLRTGGVLSDDEEEEEVGDTAADAKANNASSAMLVVGGSADMLGISSSMSRTDFGAESAFAATMMMGQSGSHRMGIGSNNQQQPSGAFQMLVSMGSSSGAADGMISPIPLSPRGVGAAGENVNPGPPTVTEGGAPASFATSTAYSANGGGGASSAFLVSPNATILALPPGHTNGVANSSTHHNVVGGGMGIGGGAGGANGSSMMLTTNVSFISNTSATQQQYHHSNTSRPRGRSMRAAAGGGGLHGSNASLLRQMGSTYSLRSGGGGGGDHHNTTTSTTTTPRNHHHHHHHRQYESQKLLDALAKVKAPDASLMADAMEEAQRRLAAAIAARGSHILEAGSEGYADYCGGRGTSRSGTARGGSSSSRGNRATSNGRTVDDLFDDYGGATATTVPPALRQGAAGGSDDGDDITAAYLTASVNQYHAHRNAGGAAADDPATPMAHPLLHHPYHHQPSPPRGGGGGGTTHHPTRTEPSPAMARKAEREANKAFLGRKGFAIRGVNSLADDGCSGKGNMKTMGDEAILERVRRRRREREEKEEGQAAATDATILNIVADDPAEVEGGGYASSTPSPSPRHQQQHPPHRHEAADEDDDGNAPPPYSGHDADGHLQRVPTARPRTATFAATATRGSADHDDEEDGGERELSTSPFLGATARPSTATTTAHAAAPTNPITTTTEKSTDPRQGTFDRLYSRAKLPERAKASTPATEHRRLLKELGDAGDEGVAIQKELRQLRREGRDERAGVFVVGGGGEGDTGVAPPTTPRRREGRRSTSRVVGGDGGVSETPKRAKSSAKRVSQHSPNPPSQSSAASSSPSRRRRYPQFLPQQHHQHAQQQHYDNSSPSPSLSIKQQEAHDAAFHETLMARYAQQMEY